MSSLIEDMAEEVTGLYRKTFVNFKNNEQDMVVEDSPAAYRPVPKAKQQIPGLNGG